MTAKIKNADRHHRHRRPNKPKGISDKAFKKVYWPYIPVILVIAVLLSMGSSAGALSAIMRYPAGSVLAYATSMSQSGLLAETNAARSQNGAAALKLNSKLNAAAQAKAKDMADRNYWSHNTPEGNPPWIFVKAQKYSYQKLGENLATGFNDEGATINGWMASPPHKQNLVDKAFTEVGFGFANNSDYTAAGGGPMTIVVAFYGKPQVLASTTSPAASKPPVSTKPAAQPPAPAPKQASQKKKAPEKQIAKEEPEKAPVTPATTETPTDTGQLANSSSLAQVALADMPLAQFGTTLALLGLFAAGGIWLSRHAFAIRRVFVHGESFAVRHPLMDIGLLMIAALLFLFSQTAGLIQ